VHEQRARNDLAKEATQIRGCKEFQTSLKNLEARQLARRHGGAQFGDDTTRSIVALRLQRHETRKRSVDVCSQAPFECVDYVDVHAGRPVVSPREARRRSDQRQTFDLFRFRASPLQSDLCAERPADHAAKSGRLQRDVARELL
jgi:hypothetical protein